MKPNEQSAKRYDPRIDILRSVAVLAVIFFHLGMFFKSGFLGVDVFFVISGYLICGQIVELHLRDRFSFEQFYARRMKRLLPALLSCLIFCLLLSFLYLNQEDFESFLSSLRFALTSISNVFFERNVDYFKVANDNSPLLHTWSLSVEEQFYFIFPATLIFALRRFKTNTYRVAQCLFIAAVVLAFAVASRVVHVGNYEMSLYYLAPYRAYQFLIGVCLALQTAYREKAPPTGKKVVYFGPAFFLLMAIFFVPRQNALVMFFLQLLISLLTARLIFLSNQFTVDVQRGLVPLVAIGKRSYSLYLFHWPVIVFSKKIFGLEKLTFVAAIGCLLISAVLSELNYRLIETFFRHRNLGARKTIASGAASVFLLLLVSLTFKTFDVPRFNNNLGLKNTDGFWKGTWDQLTKLSLLPRDPATKNILIIGDSQAADVVNLLHEKIESDASLKSRVKLSGFIVPVHCGTLYLKSQSELDHYFSVNRRILDEDNRAETQEMCTQIFRQLQQIDLAPYDEIVIANLWYDYQVEFFARTLEYIRGHAREGARIVVVGDKNIKVSLVDLIRQCEGWIFLKKNCTPSALNGEFQKSLASVELNRTLQAISQRLGVVFVNPYESICPKTGCEATVNHSPILYDSGHFSKPAISHFANSEMTKAILQ